MNTISGKTEVYGVIGNPIAHTLSPKLHNAVFSKRDVNAVYLPFKVNSDELMGAVDGLRSLNIKGLNITVPHKEQAIHYVDVIPNNMDRAIGAINTLVLSDNKILGFNTDGVGFLSDLREKWDFNPEDKTILILGAGGSSRAVSFSLLESKAKKLYIYNRTHSRGRGMSDYLKQYYPKASIHCVESISELDEPKIDLIVNCTSCGMSKSDPFPVNPEVIKKSQYVYDLIYSPSETKLVEEARSHKVLAENGLGMLIHQAAIAHRLWFPDVDKQEIIEIMRGAFNG